MTCSSNGESMYASPTSMRTSAFGGPLAVSSSGDGRGFSAESAVEGIRVAGTQLVYSLAASFLVVDMAGRGGFPLGFEVSSRSVDVGF